MSDGTADPRFPSVTVLIVSDERRPPGAWADERRAVEAVAAQDYPGAVDVILIEDPSRRAELPPGWPPPGAPIELLFEPASSSAALKNIGIARARGELVAIFEADCAPRPECLSKLVRALQEDPRACAVSARTLYRGAEGSMLRRCLNFLGRGFHERDTPGEVPWLSNNAQLMRTEVARRHPMPEHGSPFVAAQRRHAQLHAAGERFLFEPQALCVHEFEGPRFELAYRREKGYQRMSFHGAPSLAAIVPLAARSGRQMLSQLHHRGRRRLRTQDLPLALALSMLLPLLEIGGMLDALRGRPRTGRRFR